MKNLSWNALLVPEAGRRLSNPIAGTDGTASAESNLFELCRVVTEEE